MLHTPNRTTAIQTVLYSLVYPTDQPAATPPHLRGLMPCAAVMPPAPALLVRWLASQLPQKERRREREREREEEVGRSCRERVHPGSQKQLQCSTEWFSSERPHCWLPPPLLVYAATWVQVCVCTEVNGRCAKEVVCGAPHQKTEFWYHGWTGIGLASPWQQPTIVCTVDWGTLGLWA